MHNQLWVNLCLQEGKMSLPFCGIGGLNIDVFNAKKLELDLFSTPEIDVSLPHGNDVEACIRT